MSRLRQRLNQLSDQADPKRRAERESHNLAGDGLEMAARAALEGWQQRPRHPDESDVFRLGYRLACHELALVFRAMRKGEPPSKEEFAELRRLVFEDAAGEETPPTDKSRKWIHCGKPGGSQRETWCGEGTPYQGRPDGGFNPDDVTCPACKRVRDAYCEGFADRIGVEQKRETEESCSPVPSCPPSDDDTGS